MNLFIVFLFPLTLIACVDRVLRCEPATASSGRLPANCAASFLWVRQLAHISSKGHRSMLEKHTDGHAGSDQRPI